MIKQSSIQILLKSQPGLFSANRVGDLAEGKVLEKAAKILFLDLGNSGTGIVYGIEFINAKNLIRKLEKGDTVKGKIVDLDNEDGFVELSLTEADKQKVWEELKELKEKDDVLKVAITGCNSGGLLSEIKDMPAFLPVSHLSNERYPRVSEGDRNKILEELKKIVGETLEVKIIDINPRTNKLIISEREAIQESLKEALNKYSVGQTIEGIISGVADFGAFVRFTDDPNIEGLIHISELDHRLIDNPKEVVKVDDVVQAKIIDIKDGRISLSLKALKADPWEKVGEFYKEKQEITGVVYKFNPFGAFIELGNDIIGLIHVSEFGSVEDMKQRIELGKKYQFVIESIKPADKRLLLKMAGKLKEQTE